MYTRHCSILLIVLCTVHLMLPVDANAQALFWQTMNGPYGGSIASIAITPAGHVFALGSDNLVYRSTDDGESWTRSAMDGAPNGITGEELVVNKQGHIFLATHRHGVIRSTDDGEHWTQTSDGLQLMVSYPSLAITTSGTLFYDDDFGIYRSTDNGDHWVKLETVPIQRYNDRDIWTDRSGNVFMTSNFFSYENGIYRSTDNGETWSDIATGLSEKTVIRMAFNHRNDIFIVHEEQFERSFLRSTDNGIHWTRLETEFIPSTIDIDSSGRIYISVAQEEYRTSLLRSTDNGENWTLVSEGLDMVPWLRRTGDIAFNADDHIFITPEGSGVFRSTDTGERWTRTSNGLSAAPLSSIAFGRTGNLFVGADYGQVFRSTDNGLNWTLSSNGIRVQPFAGPTLGSV